MIAFSDLKDGNGKPIQDLAEELAREAREHDFLTIAVFLSKEKGAVHVVTNVDGSVPGLLEKLAKTMASSQPN